MPANSLDPTIASGQVNGQWLLLVVSRGQGRGEGEIFLRDSGHYVNNDGVVLVVMTMRKQVQCPV